MIHSSGETLATRSPAQGATGGILLWLVAGYLILLPVQVETPFDIRFAPSDLFLLAALPLGIFTWRIGGPAWSLWHVAMIGVFVLWMVAKVLAVGSVPQFVLLNKLGGIVLLFASYLCLTTLADSWAKVRWLLRAFVTGVVVQNTVSVGLFLWARYTGGDNPWLVFFLSGNFDRLAGMLVDANAYGGLLSVAYALVLLDSDRRDPLLPRWFRLVSLLSLSAGLFLTSSRSAWIGFALLTLVGAARNPRLLILVVLMVGVGVAAVAYFAGDGGFDSIVEVSGRQGTIEERVVIARDALQMFADHPGFGAGIGAFYEEHDIVVHNSALWFLAEFGAVGFTVFAGFAGWFLVTGVAAYRRVAPGQRSLVAGLLAAHLAMMGFSLGVEAFYQRSWWLVMAMIGAVAALAARTTSDEGRGTRGEGRDRGVETGPSRLGASSRAPCALPLAPASEPLP
jgi:O-antigen ligase